MLVNVIVTDESWPNEVPSLAVTFELLELYVHSCAPDIETSARAALVERVAAAAKAVVPKSNLRIAYPLIICFRYENGCVTFPPQKCLNSILLYESEYKN